MTTVRSRLFEPVLWRGSGFYILDEIQLPEKTEYLEVRDVAEALRAVREMKTRAFGQVLTFLYSAALLAQERPNADKAELSRRLTDMTEEFSCARPTFDFRGLSTFFDDWLKNASCRRDVGEALACQARERAQSLIRRRLDRARLAATILPNPARVLTHCNVSGELVAIAQYCKELGKEISVIATETRPYLQGTRLTSWELAEAGIPVSVMPDCAIAQVMSHGEVNAVIVGADRSARNADIINKVGTYPLALMAKEYGVPFHALVQDPRSLASGDDVTIEERSALELLTYQGQPLVHGNPERLNTRYPAFDLTPEALITSLIDFDGIYAPEAFRQKYLGEIKEPRRCPMPQRRYLLIYGVPPRHQYGFLGELLDNAGADSFLVPEMRPQLWGLQAVVPEMLARDMPVTLISDNMMGTLFAQKEILRLCLFHDGLSDAGATGICGSLLVARLARLHAVPIELYSGAKKRGLTVDRDVSTLVGRPILPRGVTIQYVRPEIVPASLLRN